MPESLGHALLIANARYSDPTLSALGGTEVDVKALEAVLADPAIGGYQVQTSLDEPIHQLRQCIERFFVLQAPKDGLLLLYLSGHGVKDRDGRLYFAAADTESQFLMSTGLAATFIQEASERSRCRRQVFIFDACFSGAFAKGYTHKADQKVHAQEPFSGGTGKIILTASDDMQYAWVGDEIEGSAAASVFTRHLVEGLRTGAAAKDAATVTAERLYQYVHERVLQDHPAQKPQFWCFGLKGDLVLARNPAPKPVKLPADIVELLEDAKPIVRLLGIDEMEKLLAEMSLHPAIALALEKLKDDDSRMVYTRAAEVQAKLAALRQAEELERQAEVEAKRLAEEESKRLVEEERQRLAEKESKRLAEEERKRKAEAEAQRQAEEERKRKAEAEAQRQADEERKRLAEAEAKRLAEVERKRLAEAIAEAERLDDEEQQRRVVAESKRLAAAQTERPVGENGRSRKRVITAVALVVLLVSFFLYQAQWQSPPAAPTPEPAWEAQHTFGLEMVSIPAGEFFMGSYASDKQASNDEKPRHTVKVSAFKIGKTEVTQGQWKAVMGSNPSHFKDCGDNCPVEHVSFDEAQAFIEKLNTLTGKSYRLPKEAEWEYACRAGGDFKYCGGNNSDTVAWHGENSGSKTYPVGGKQPNAFGLYDMSGNVWEWTCSVYTDRYGDGSESTCATAARRVIRGGSWSDGLGNLRSADRYGNGPDSQFDDLGFRLAQD
jgi:formylglycine-generating enzyme required for sulfatase activity